MKVIIIGDRNRESPADVKLVHAIIEACRDKYPKLRVITRGCDRGVGKIVKNYLTNPATRKPRYVDWTEVSLQHHLVDEDLPRMEFSNDYDALNSTLVEMGDEFHILSEERPRGVIMNLLRRVIQANRAYALYKPQDEKVLEAKFPESSEEV